MDRVTNPLTQPETTSATNEAAGIRPIAVPLEPVPDVFESLARFQSLPGCLLLESARQFKSPRGRNLGRCSFLMADPFDWIEFKAGADDPFSPLQDHLRRFRIDRDASLPPFQGGLAGLFSYDLNRSLEAIAPARHDEFQLPALAIGAYDAIVAWDHFENRAWLVSTGFPELDPAARVKRANQRIEWLRKQLASSPTARTDPPSGDRVELDHQFSVNAPVGLVSNFSEANYIRAVQKCIDYIYAGDVFQINLAQRLMFPANADSVELYRRLRRCNPAPFSGYFDLSRNSAIDAQIISASPERLFSVADRVVETRPIKGTRRRTGTPMVDIYARDQLIGSVKDRAENTMIVDLMRNDLSRCCLDHSIRVGQLCELEEYQSVFHLVSSVQGTLKPDCTLVDLIRSVFPGGSITGAPKVRAMEIIAELEPHARGAYCGSLGYLGYDGNADFNILIRTITARRGWWQIPVGGGIVSQSDPRREYDETWTKAASMLRAVTDLSEQTASTENAKGNL